MTQLTLTNLTINQGTSWTLSNTQLATPPDTQSVNLPENHPTSLPSTPPMSPEVNSAADIWDDDQGGHETEEVLSDLPAIKRQHMTDGYREGLSTSKSTVMQAGFDEGYPIGAQIAMRAGPILGVLEGFLACASISVIPKMREKVQNAYMDAIRDLDVGYLMHATDEEVLASIKTMPDAVEQAISFWEGKVTAVYGCRQQSMLIMDQENPHALRDMVEAAKIKNPVNFDTDHTDKKSRYPVVQEKGKEENQYRRKGRSPVW